MPNDARIVGVRFSPADKVHFCATADVTVQAGDLVEVDTPNGSVAARIVIAPGQIIGSDLDYVPRLIVKGSITER